MTVNRISPTIQEFNGERYYLCGHYFQHKGRRLHVQVWMYHNDEPIPKGFHVHHKDGDRANNDINNLELVTAYMHMHRHGQDPSREEYNKRHIEDIRDLAKEWHGSDAGRAWHSESAKKQWEVMPEKEYKCTMCGKTFMSIRNYSPSDKRFCCNGCKSNYRRLSGVDDVERLCAYCGKPFMASKYSKIECCSKQCASNRRWNK